MGKDKSILDKITDTVKGVASTASDALKPDEEATKADERTATYVPLAADGLVSDPVVPPVATPRKRRAAPKRAATSARRTAAAAKKAARKRSASKAGKKSAKKRSAKAAKKTAKKTKAAKKTRKTRR